MIAGQPDHAVYHFSFEEGVQTYKPFVKQIQASYNFTDYYLEAHQDIGELSSEQNIIEYQKDFTVHFRVCIRKHLDMMLWMQMTF